MTDIVIDLFDACLWQRHTDAKKELDEMRLKAARETNEKLRTYKEVVKILIDSEVKDAAVRAKVFRRFNRGYLQQVVPETENHLRPRNDEAIDLFAQRYSYIRQFAPRFLETLTFKSHKPASPLLKAIKVLKTLNASGQRAVPKDAPTAFITDVWRDYVVEHNGTLNRRYYELAVLWELRQALRSGDVFVSHARRYADPNTYLIPRQHWPLQHQVGCLNLLTNAVILWNSVYMDKVLKQLESEGYEVNYQDLLHIWPTRCKHINVHGKYEFNFEVARQRTGLRELRQPGELNP